MVKDKLVITAWMVEKAYYQEYDGRTNIFYSHMIYLKAALLASPIIDIRDIGRIPVDKIK